MGEVISQELAAAMVGLNGPEKRRTRRLVRRGKAAEDVAVARYAVAFARERQRRLKRSSARFATVGGVALGLAGLVVALIWFKRALDAKAVAAAVFAAWFLVISWRNWQMMRNVEAAERANCEYLRRSGAPYVPGGPPTRVNVPPLVMACSWAIRLLVAITVGGLVTLALNGESLSFGKALSVGAWGGIGGGIGAVIAGASVRSREDAALTEYLRARDVD
jgi:hypothetical protein